jgi:uncharacterized membrane protein YccC
MAQIEKKLSRHLAIAVALAGLTFSIPAVLTESWLAVLGIVLTVSYVSIGLWLRQRTQLD